MRYVLALLCLISFLAPAPASATDVTLTWAWPDSYCAQPGQTVGDALSLSDISAAERLQDGFIHLVKAIAQPRSF